MFNLIHSKQSHSEQRKHLSKCFSTAEGHTKVRQVVLDNSFLNTVKISWELVCILQIHTTTDETTAFFSLAQSCKRVKRF